MTSVQKTAAQRKAEAEKALAGGLPAFPKNGRPTKQETDTKNAVMDIFMLGTQVKIEEMIQRHFEKMTAPVNERINELIEKANSYREIRVITESGTHEVSGLTHSQFELLLQLLALPFPILVTGPAGTGKSHAAEQAANAMCLSFHSQSVGAQTSKSDLLGFMHAGGEYIRTSFRDAYEHGGVFLMDEIDAGNPNVLIVINSALSNDFCSFPDGMVRRHPDFRFIATANTYGRGADRNYVGRNQLDAATLDRFITIDWEIDESLETQLISSYTHGSRWFKVVKGLRKVVEDHSYRLIISPRATLKGASMLELGISFDQVVKMCITSAANPTEAEVLRDNAKKLW